MKKYEFVNVDYKMKGVSIAVVSEHREIIEKYASQGYKYIGMIPTEMKVNGCIRNMDLIFEKDE